MYTIVAMTANRLIATLFAMSYKTFQATYVQDQASSERFKHPVSLFFLFFKAFPFSKPGSSFVER